MNVFVKLDKSSRLVLPKKIRETVNATEFNISVDDDKKIIFIPVKTTDEMFGSMPDLNLASFYAEHKKER